MRLSAIAVIGMAGLLTACAASREDLNNEKDMKWGTYTVENSPMDVYRNTIEGSRICGEWTPVIHSNNNNKEVHFTIYISKIVLIIHYLVTKVCTESVW